MFTWFFMASKRAKNWGNIRIWCVVWNFLLLCLYLPIHFPAIQLHKTMLVISSSYWLSIVSPNINLVVTRVSLNVPNPHYYYMCYHCYLLFCLIREKTKMRKPHSKSEFEPVLASEPAFFLFCHSFSKINSVSDHLLNSHIVKICHSVTSVIHSIH